MDFASIQAQLANLTAQLTHNAERTSMPSVPTRDAPYGQRYQTYQYPQFSAYEDAWGYQGYDQSRGNMYSNACHSDCRDYSEYMWGEPQHVQHEAYWQPYESYSTPMQPPQPHLQYAKPGSSKDYNQILTELISLTQGSQIQAEEAQQGGYWQQEEEFYHWPYESSQPPKQSAQNNSGTSLDNDTLVKILTKLSQGQENQIQEMQDRANKVDKLEKQVGQIMEIMAQIQDQSDVEDEVVPEPSKHSPNMDELLLQAEDEEDDLGSLDEFLSQTPQVPMSSNSGEEVLSSIHSNFLPPNVLFPCRILIPNIEESEKDIVEALPKVQSDIPTLGAPKQVPEPCTPRKEIQENEVAGECVKLIKEDVLVTTIPEEIGLYDTGQVTTLKTPNMAKFSSPKTFEVVFEFVSEHTGKPPPRISISVYIYMLLMIQSPTQECKPLPDHFKYHTPFKDQIHAEGLRGV